MGDDEGRVWLYDVATRSVYKQFTAHADCEVDAVRFSTRADRLLTAGRDHLIRIWRFPELTLLGTLSGHNDQIECVRMAADGASVASCGREKTVKIWDTITGKLRRDIIPVDIIWEVAFSPDGRMLAGACKDHKAHVWHTSDGSIVEVFSAHHDQATSVAWSPDGHLLASGARDGKICFWNMQTHVQDGHLNADQGDISSVAFSGDGTTLASAGTQGTVKLWDVDTREEMLVLKGHSNINLSVGFASRADVLYSFAYGRQCELLLWPAVGQAESGAGD